MLAINAIIIVIVASLLLWLLYSSIKHNPELFSAKNLNKSLYTLGILAIFLIVAIGVTIVTLNS